MRKIMMMAILALSFFAAAGAQQVRPDPLPDCEPNCPWVR